MKLLRLSLRSFRNYDECRIEPGEGVNLFLGENGSGKTNLAEAVYCLSLGRGWRSPDIAPLIKDGAKEALVEARVESRGLTHDIELRFMKRGRQAKIDGHPIRKLSELSSLVSVVSYAPEDALFYKGPPGVRRTFLDLAISKADEGYLRLAKTHQKLLEERNALLKGETVDRLALEVLTERLVMCEAPIDEARKKFLSLLEHRVSGLLSELKGEEMEARIDYRPFLKSDDPIPEARALYARALATDLERRTTTVGTHREDFALLEDGKSVGAYGSQGENRLASIATKLAPAMMAGKEGSIVILDDAWSELDEKRGENLKALLPRLGQCFVTATSFDCEGARRFDIGRGTAATEE